METLSEKKSWSRSQRPRKKERRTQKYRSNGSYKKGGFSPKKKKKKKVQKRENREGGEARERESKIESKEKENCKIFSIEGLLFL